MCLTQDRMEEQALVLKWRRVLHITRRRSFTCISEFFLPITPINRSSVEIEARAARPSLLLKYSTQIKYMYLLLGTRARLLTPTHYPTRFPHTPEFFPTSS
jgi:hypothetical protein